MVQITSLCIGSSKINQRGVIAGTYTYEYSTKAESAKINVNVQSVPKCQKQGGNQQHTFLRYII